MNKAQFIQLLKDRRTQIRLLVRQRIKYLIDNNEPLTEDVYESGREQIELINQLIRLTLTDTAYE